MQWFYLSKTDLWRGRLSLQIHLGELNLEGRKASAGLVMGGGKRIVEFSCFVRGCKRSTVKLKLPQGCDALGSGVFIWLYYVNKAKVCFGLLNSLLWWSKLTPQFQVAFVLL